MLARLVSSLVSAKLAKRAPSTACTRRSPKSGNVGWWLPPRSPGGRDHGGGGGGGGGHYVYKVNLGHGGGQYDKYDVSVEGDQVVVRGTSADSSTFELRHRLPPDVDLSSVNTQMDSKGTVTITAKIKSI